MTHPDRAPKGRYFDPDFFALEAEQLWSRTWQMACRLQEIPEPDDFTVYDILDQSVIVVRADDVDGNPTVHALHNACRHRGVQVVDGPGRCESGFTCPFHGWCYAADGTNTFVSKAKSFSEHNMAAGDVDLVPVRAEVWGGCVWVNFDAEAPPLRDCIEPFATIMEGWQLEDMQAEWWYSFRLPVNWKLAEEAFLEQYHVIESHPQLVDPDRFVPRDPTTFDPKRWLDAEIRYLRTMNEGMAGMVHDNDVAIAERIRDIELPADPALAMQTWQRTFNDAVVEWHREQNHRLPDLNQLEAEGNAEPMGYCFPHFFVLPMYSSASQYRFRPLGPEETLMEIWSLRRFPEGEPGPKLPVPEPWDHDDERVPPIPSQDFSNLPRQQRGVHSRGFEYLRLSEGIEGGVANFERAVDGFLEGRSYDELLTALRTINVNPLEQPIQDLGF